MSTHKKSSKKSAQHFNVQALMHDIANRLNHLPIEQWKELLTKGIETVEGHLPFTTHKTTGSKRRKASDVLSHLSDLSNDPLVKKFRALPFVKMISHSVDTATSTVSTQITRILNVPSRKDLNALERQLREISNRLDSMLENSGAAGTARRTSADNTRPTTHA